MKAESIDWEATMRATQGAAEKAALMSEKALAEAIAMARRQSLLFGEVQKLQAAIQKPVPIPSPALPLPSPEPARPSRPLPFWRALLPFGLGVACGVFFGS